MRPGNGSQFDVPRHIPDARGVDDMLTRRVVHHVQHVRVSPFPPIPPLHLRPARPAVQHAHKAAHRLLCRERFEREDPPLPPVCQRPAELRVAGAAYGGVVGHAESCPYPGRLLILRLGMATCVFR